MRVPVHHVQITEDKCKHYLLGRYLPRFCKQVPHIAIYLINLLRHIGEMRVPVHQEQITGDEGKHYPLGGVLSRSCEMRVPVHQEQITGDEGKHYPLGGALSRSCRLVAHVRCAFQYTKNRSRVMKASIILWEELFQDPVD
ncbi:hypothetical protein CDAR_385581 [Caerostris darwini]|uniref:Uncharacterized protein n=1 Tax=Caerostris darwini TaxID=1538125 RepID=A0AAV4M418_9ARAC|nr:hypothetical protein CDAR_385581 [Caerostris darwini]